MRASDTGQPLRRTPLPNHPASDHELGRGNHRLAARLFLAMANLRTHTTLLTAQFTTTFSRFLRSHGIASSRFWIWFKLHFDNRPRAYPSMMGIPCKTWPLAIGIPLQAIGHSNDSGGWGQSLIPSISRIARSNTGPGRAHPGRGSTHQRLLSNKSLPVGRGTVRVVRPPNRGASAALARPLPLVASVPSLRNRSS